MQFQGFISHRSTESLEMLPEWYTANVKTIDVLLLSNDLF
jgi:hypothetical protein